MYPYNCLVLPGDFVVANEKTPRFLGLLKELGVSYATVNADKSYDYGGSIRCRTHYTPNFDLIARLPKIQRHRITEDYSCDEYSRDY